MALRMFRCEECGHKMRVGGEYCGACHASKPDWQSPSILVQLTTMTAITLVVPTFFIN